MKATEEQYNRLLYLIQNYNPTDIIPLCPDDEEIYEIDLNSRSIKSAPEFLSVTSDHRAEMIFFKTSRYFDGVDLANKACIIQYTNAAKPARSGIYVVPYIDVETFKARNEGEIDQIVFPWLIDAKVTEAAGSVSYSVQFFQVNEAGKYLYCLNTVPATSKILEGDGFDHLAVADDINRELNSILDEEVVASGATINLDDYSSSLAAAYDLLIQKMNEIRKDQLMVYWIDV